MNTIAYSYNPLSLIEFPNPEKAEGGIVAVGGNLSVEMLLSAYMQGVFPWYAEDEPLLWWSPDPRFVLPTAEFHIPSRLKRFLKTKPFTYTINTSFEKVITCCARVKRAGQNDTWINPEMINAYIALHKTGFAHSIEAWKGDPKDGIFAGGFYGVAIGELFFGESMCTVIPEASKCAFCFFAERFRAAGGKLIDSQVYTDNIARFGGRNISRTAFLRQEKELLHVPTIFASLLPQDKDTVLHYGC